MDTLPILCLVVMNGTRYYYPKTGREKKTDLYFDFYCETIIVNYVSNFCKMQKHIPL